MSTYRFSFNGEARSVESRDTGQPLLYVLRTAPFTRERVLAAMKIGYA